MSKKIGFGILGIVVLVAAFFLGSAYGKSQAASITRTAFSGVGGRIRGAGMGGGFGGMTVGQIISKDTTSITIQLTSAPTTPGTAATTPRGSEIVFIDNNTKISKQTTGTMNDLAVGTEVFVSGTANSDGSLSAQSVQIRPVTVTRPATTTGTQ